MSEKTFAKLKYDNKDIYAEVANRDGSGNVITKTYALKSVAPELPSDSSDGTYVLKAVKSGDTITYSWVLEG